MFTIDLNKNIHRVTVT